MKTYFCTVLSKKGIRNEARKTKEIDTIQCRLLTVKHEFRMKIYQLMV